MSEQHPEFPATAAPSSAAASSSSWERQTLERLAFAMLEEQKATRRWRTAMRLLWLGFLAVVVWLFYGEVPETATTTTPHTAMIEIRGEIGAGTEVNANSVLASLRSAFEDDGAQAVVLLIDSPGGSPVQAGLINDEIYRLKALHKKPVYAVVEETCASAAYYIATAADQIYVDKASLVGSIGVLMDGFGFTGLMDKVGVERRLLTAGENKGFLDPFSPQSATQRAYAEDMLKQIHAQFIEVVKKGRGDRLQITPETFSGLVWNGQKAVELGLADGLGSLDQVARDVVKAEDIIDYTQRENVAERLAKRFGAGMGETALKLAHNAGWSLR
ncbi:MAG TPA: S49 family peptidase [Macromonas sp.]|nr:S49 family peptidase [Macromonas sp.]